MDPQDILAQTITELEKLDPKVAFETALAEFERARRSLAALDDGPASLRMLRSHLAVSAAGCQRYAQALSQVLMESEKASYTDLEQAQREYSFGVSWLASYAGEPVSRALEYALHNLAEAYRYHPGAFKKRSPFLYLADRLQEEINKITRTRFGVSDIRDRISLLAK